MFGFFSKKNDFDIKIYAPLSGDVIAIENVDDPVFSQKMVGDGLAINPKSDVVLAPCSGTVKLLHSSHHAIAIETERGFEVLIHVGLDTVELKGQGFSPLVTTGQKVNVGDELIKLDLDFLSKNARSVHTLVVVSNLEGNFINKTESSSVNAKSDVLFSINSEKKKLNLEPKDSSKKETSSKGNDFSAEVTVLMHAGLHARPASKLVTLAKSFTSEVILYKGDREANAKNLIPVLGLGADFKEKIKIVTKGADAKEALQTIVAGFNEGFGDDIKAQEDPSQKKEVKINSNTITKTLRDIDFSKEVTLSGIQIFPSLVIGNIFKLEAKEIKIEENSNLGKEKETSKLDSALNKVKENLLAEIKKAESAKSKEKVTIFTAHLSVLDDTSITEVAKNYIQKGKTASFGYRESIKESIKILESTGNELLKERVADLKDIEQQVIRDIEGIAKEKLAFGSNSIVLAEDLIPSNISDFDDNVKGVVLAKGSTTSHVSIMLKNIGIPSLVAVGEEILKVKEGTNVILDSKNREIVFNPNNEKINITKDKIVKLEEAKTINIKNSKLPAKTLDGTSVEVTGNIGNIEQAKVALENGAEGIGLLRTEFLFFESEKPISEDDQNKLYQGVIDAMQGHSVIIRTMDIGGDKPLNYIKIPDEENPVLGIRGARNYYLNDEEFRKQIRALLRVKPLNKCKIMIPMITFVDEVIAIKKLIEEEKAKLGIKDEVVFGIMVEVPAAALMVEQFAKYVDFFSIGSNDLCQYTMAIDRGHPDLSYRLDNLSPALLRMIKISSDGANKHKKTIGVCGAMASELEAVPLLLGLGVRDLAASRSLIPDIKALIRQLDIKKCQALVEKALTLESSDEVRVLVKKELEDNKIYI